MSSFDNKDAVLPSTIHPILIEKHAKFLAGYNAQNNPYEFAVTEHLRMNGMYWSLTALSLMNSLHLLDQEEIVSFIKKCQHLSPTSTSALSDNINNNNSNNNNNNNKDGPSTNSETKETSEHTEHNDHNEDKANSPERKLHELHKSQYGGFGASLGHDAHLLSTLSAVQILCLYDRVHEIDTNAVVSFVSSLQQPDGSFVGDIWGEVDTRFTFCAFACLSLLGRLDAIDVEKGIDFVMSCLNFDGGFGRLPGSETHAAQVYVCLGTLSIAGVLDEKVDRDQLGWWLAERQMTKSGGLNGRPEKLPDVCYSWWVLASLCMIDRLHWIDSQKLITFILACQDDENGGIADRPNDLADPYHTLFGLAGISLLSRLFVMENSANDGTTSTTATAAALATTATIVATKLKEINPIYCMPQEVIDRVFQSQNKK